MKRRTYPAGQRFELLRADTFYRVLDAGLCCGAPVAAPAGLVVTVIERPAAWTWEWPAREHRPEVLCRAEIDGAPAYGWLLLSWLDPINPQGVLFECAHPKLF